MKSILYVGATLMIGASIYGFVNYKQTNDKKEFKDMYTEKKAVVPAVVSDEKTTEPEVKKETAKKTKNVVSKKKEESNEIEIAGIKPIPADQKLKTTDTDITGIGDVTVVPAKENNIVKKKKRKFGIKEFSRAPLRDDIDEEVVTSVKKSSKKLEIKER